MSVPTSTNPADIARDVLRQLVQRRTPPTPENYARAYAERAGRTLAEVQPAIAALGVVAESLRNDHANTRHGRELAASIEQGDWASVRITLRSVLGRLLEPPPPRPPAPSPVLVGSASRSLKELFAKTVEFLVDERLGYGPEIVREAAMLVEAVKAAESQADLDRAGANLRQFWLKLELRGEGPEATIRGLHGLLQLLLRNIGDLVVDDRWVQGQVERVQQLIAGPVTPKALAEAERSFKEFVYRQGALKHSLDEAKAAIKDMMAAFIDRLGAITQSTGEFSAKITRYSERVRAADDLPQISDILEKLLTDTNSMQADVSRTHRELDSTRQKVIEYETRIRELQAELEQMSDLVKEDPLTLALNRRGLAQQYSVEEARADRKRAPLCLAVLDIDNFKHLNDQLGHAAGDDALRHLANVVRQVLRPTDSLARYGGEEFVILLPETDLVSAEIAMLRVQRELTKRFFLHNNERVLITFSAGIAERRPDETQEQVIARADEAMYRAKRAGKNRVERAG